MIRTPSTVWKIPYGKARYQEPTVIAVKRRANLRKLPQVRKCNIQMLHEQNASAYLIVLVELISSLDVDVG